MLDKHSLAELADIYKEKYNRLLKDNVELEMQIDEANVEVERLCAERDAARRELCRNEAIIRLQRHRVHRAWMGLFQKKLLTEFLSQNTVTDGVYNAATWCGDNNKKERF
jgi:hypothetical protein